jgi:hypothetical protein
VTGRPLSGAEELRRTVALLNNCREDFNDRFSAVQLLQLARAYRACGWDFPPDRWTERQLLECVAFGIVPAWDDREAPMYSNPTPSQVGL